MYRFSQKSDTISKTWSYKTDQFNYPQNQSITEIRFRILFFLSLSLTSLGCLYSDICWWTVAFVFLICTILIPLAYSLPWSCQVVFFIASRNSTWANLIREVVTFTLWGILKVLINWNGLGELAIQAFQNEALIREASGSPSVLRASVGHEWPERMKDRKWKKAWAQEYIISKENNRRAQIFRLGQPQSQCCLRIGWWGGVEFPVLHVTSKEKWRVIQPALKASVSCLVKCVCQLIPV
jgi:hypothetical protein